MSHTTLENLIEAARKEKIRLNNRGNQPRTMQERRYIKAVEELYISALEYLEQDDSFDKAHTKINPE